MDELEDTKEFSQGIQLLARQIAMRRANVAKWDLNIVVMLFSILAVLIILVSLKIDSRIVAAVATLGLASVWVMGWRRGKQLVQHFVVEELSSLRQEPIEDSKDLVEPLTSREVQILEFAAQGLINKRIAVELGISINTVKVMMSKILTKMDAKDRTEAVVRAIKNGIISVP